MVLAFCMSLQLVAVEVDFAQVSGGVALRFVVEVVIARMAALASGGNGPCAHAVTELDDGDETVAARAVPLLRVGIGARSEGCERSPYCGGEAHGNARLRVVEMRDDLVI